MKQLVNFSQMSILPLILFLILLHVCSTIRFDLGGTTQWRFYSPSLANLSGRAAKVPGDIYGDLQANDIIDEPLFGSGDKRFRWVAYQDWVYERHIQLPDASLKAYFMLLHFEGLDSPASIFLNDHHLADLDNQFVSLTIDVKRFLVPGLNFLRISFKSPIKMAKERAENYELLNLHKLPPECNPPVYNGECHVQFLRKMQASFAWDWGPSFPSMGIWRPVFLEYFSKMSIQQFSPLVDSVGDSFLVSVHLSLMCHPRIRHFNVQLALPGLNISKTFIMEGTCPKIELDDKLHIRIPHEKVQLWYPRGYGNQNMYALQAMVTTVNGCVLAKASKRIAFRTIVLNQSLVNTSQPTKGRLFQFEVNGIPIFLKGTNWVPVSSFPAREHSARRQFLFHSMIEANMNVLRVWGGGFYENDNFYQMADELGLLIWQDFMFACALYPTDAAFLRSVKSELEQQVLRLRHHPSVLCWAGNNENELAVRTHWWPTWNYAEQAQARDYLALYKAQVEPTVEALDPSRPFLLSSPSNGKETEEEGGIARNPGDPAFGDVHFYSETVNLWKAYNYPVPRCASEFGLQSFPLRGTMQRWLDASDWRYTSEALTERQHHPGGVLTLPLLVFEHFNLPTVGLNSSSAPNRYLLFSAISQSQSSPIAAAFMDQFAFLSQVHQAIALKTQIEHYRRWRSRLDHNSLGQTMCAMYWQLNDVWAAPTWSTVDFDLRWKLAHHFVQRSFAPLIVSLYLDEHDQLHIFIVSDLISPTLNATLHIELFVVQLGLNPIYRQSQQIGQIQAQSATEFQINPVMLRVDEGYDSDRYLLTAQLLDEYSDALSPVAVLYPDKLYYVGQYGSAKLIGFTQYSNTVFGIRIQVDNVLPLVWVDLNEQFKTSNPEVLYYFEENAFAATRKHHNVTLKLFSNPKTVNITRDDIQILIL